jgi:hypothetical protein
MVPAPQGAPVVAPLIDAADVQKNVFSTAGPVHWISSDTVPTATGVRWNLTDNRLEQAELASPLRALTSPGSLRGRSTTYPVQR